MHASSGLQLEPLRPGSAALDLICVCVQGRWLMLTEELAQVHQALAPVPLWFRYLVTNQEVDSTLGLTLGVLLALLYLILKVGLRKPNPAPNNKTSVSRRSPLLLSALRTVQPLDVSAENCEDLSPGRGQLLCPTVPPSH